MPDEPTQAEWTEHDQRTGAAYAQRTRPITAGDGLGMSNNAIENLDNGAGATSRSEGFTAYVVIGGVIHTATFDAIVGGAVS